MLSSRAPHAAGVARLRSQRALAPYASALRLAGCSALHSPRERRWGGGEPQAGEPQAGGPPRAAGCDVASLHSHPNPAAVPLCPARPLRSIAKGGRYTHRSTHRVRHRGGVQTLLRRQGLPRGAAQRLGNCSRRVLPKPRNGSATGHRAAPTFGDATAGPTRCLLSRGVRARCRGGRYPAPAHGAAPAPAPQQQLECRPGACVPQPTAASSLLVWGHGRPARASPRGALTPARPRPRPPRSRWGSCPARPAGT